MLYHLGLDKEIIGITKFCVHPREWFSSKTRIGGTKSVHIEQVKNLQPDLIIANKEENLKEQVEALADLFPVYTSDIANLKQAIEMIITIGQLTGTEAAAQSITERIQESFAALTRPSVCIRTAYLIWQHPFMTVGGDTFIHDMLGRCGFDNIFKDKQRYPEITIADLARARCQLLLLSSEPFPFKEKHVQEIQSQLPSTKIMLADGEMFSWYGSRLLLAPDYFYKLMLDL